MGGFGFLAPCPIRLGGTPQQGLTAEQHARLCEHLVSLSNTGPLFEGVIRHDPTGATTRFTSYAGRNGTGLKNAPRVTGGVSGFAIDLSVYANSLGYEVDLAEYAANGCGIEASAPYSGLTCVSRFTNYDFRLSVFVPYPGTEQDIIVTVYGTKPTEIGTFGGHLQKRNSTTEENTTYTATWYEILRDASGTAFTKSSDSVVAWENIAHARALGTSQRISEMLAASSNPGGSDVLLGRWCKVLGIQQGAMPQWQVRAACEDAYVGLQPVTHDTLDAGLRFRMGAFYDSIVSNAGTDLEPWPPASYWPGVVNGDGQFNIDGTGNWSSSRANFNIILDQTGLTIDDALNKFDKLATAYLTRVVSSTSTWTPCASVGGFIIGTSQIGAAAI